MAMNPKKVVRKVLPSAGTKVAEETYRKSRIHAMQMRYGYPARDLQIIGVTGTNGKTTTCMMINSMLKNAGYKTALFTTAVVEVDGKQEVNTRHTTVPITSELLSFFKKAKDSSADYVVLEVTSHALHQHKVMNVPIEVAVFTNLSQDHLDYHGSMEEYTAMKARLFNRYLNPTYCVLNRDDPKYGYFEKQSVGLPQTYGEKNGSDVRISDVKASKKGTEFQLSLDGEKATVQLPMIGMFNVSNAAAAAATGSVLGLKLSTIATGLSKMDQVPGRMQPVEAGQSFGVFVDYAVTPDALEKALVSLQVSTKGRVLAVFGATGDRDKDKRPKMGEAVAKHADKIYLTDDETYTEAPAAIRKMVMKGIKKGKGISKTKEISDREKAIAAALKAAKKDDIVYVTGIGHQDSRNMGGKLEPWNEVETIKKLLKNHKK
jgi:UDP-N-acetylmuramoyl-L-alanyl-D-glutamate--2,6-diaminopimelate ligase